MALGITEEKRLSSARESRPSDVMTLPASLSPIAEMNAVRSLIVHFRELLGISAEQGPADPMHRRLGPSAASVLEHTLYLRDLLHAAAERLERLADDVRPVQVQLPTCKPIAGYHQWSREELLRDLSAGLEHLDRVADEVATDERLHPNVRQAIQSITAEILHNAVLDGEDHRRQAELGLTGA
jgi:hypothetical protein